jgi:uncharacterized protein
VVGRAGRAPPRRAVAGVSSPLASALYVGSVRHRRHRPVVNAFRYRAYHVLVDLDELPRLDREVRGFAYNRRGATSFWDRDHLGPAALPAREKLARWLVGEGVVLPAGPVRVLTNLRVMGYVFNPVSWWFCHHPDGRLALVVAEVDNTFGDAHCYLLDDLEHRPDGTVRARADKVFHVSPFLPVDGLGYRFTIVAPGPRALVHMDVEDAEGTVLDATQDGQRVALTSRTLARTLVTHPLVTLRTIAQIHRQALRLWRKRVTFHRRPAPPPDGYERVAAPPTRALAAASAAASSSTDDTEVRR